MVVFWFYMRNHDIPLQCIISMRILCTFIVASMQGIWSALKELLLLPFKFILPNQLGKYEWRNTGCFCSLQNCLIVGELCTLRYSRPICMPACVTRCRVPTLVGVWTWWPLMLPSNPCDSVIMWRCISWVGGCRQTAQLHLSYYGDHYRFYSQQVAGCGITVLSLWDSSEHLLGKETTKHCQQCLCSSHHLFQKRREEQGRKFSSTVEINCYLPHIWPPSASSGSWEASNIST